MACHCFSVQFVELFIDEARVRNEIANAEITNGEITNAEITTTGRPLSTNRPSLLLGPCRARRSFCSYQGNECLDSQIRFVAAVPSPSPRFSLIVPILRQEMPRPQSIPDALIEASLLFHTSEP